MAAVGGGGSAGSTSLFTECEWKEVSKKIKKKKEEGILECTLKVQREQEEKTTESGSSGLTKKPETSELVLRLDASSLSVVFKPDERPRLSSVHLEWLDERSGRYIYYSLRDLAEVMDADSQVERTVLSAVDSRVRPRFDESCDVDAVLFEHDWLVKSPLRSADKSTVSGYSRTSWTRMGVYCGHWLYLGGTPTLDFVRSQAISHLFNCRMAGNKSEVSSAAKRGESIFDVARWSHSRMDPSLQLSELDSKVDLIRDELEKGNVFVHCLAGAHRSPFVTACFLVKHGGFAGQSARQVYAHMQALRPIVEPLSYDTKLDGYVEWLSKQ